MVECTQEVLYSIGNKGGLHSHLMSLITKMREPRDVTKYFIMKLDYSNQPTVENSTV